MSETQTPEKTKSTRQMSFDVLADGTIRADFGPGLEPLTIDPANEVPEALHVQAITEGLKARARAYTSRLAADERTPENLRVAIAKAFSDFRAGVWEVVRAGSVLEEFTQEIRAAYGFQASRAAEKGLEFTDTLAQVAVNWRALTEDQQKQVKALPRYQLALAKVKAEDAAKKAEALSKKVAQSEEESPF